MQDIVANRTKMHLFVSLAFLKCTGRRILRVMIFFFILYSTCIKSGGQLLSCIGKKAGFDLNNVIICTDLHVSFFLVEVLILIRFIRFLSTKKQSTRLRSAILVVVVRGFGWCKLLTKCGFTRAVRRTELVVGCAGRRCGGGGRIGLVLVWWCGIRHIRIWR